MRNATECNAECPGDNNQMCGGIWRMNIYNINLMECVYGSILMEHVYPPLPFDLTTCRDFCSHTQFTGFHDDSQCFCGRTAQQNDRDRVTALCNPDCPDGPVMSDDNSDPCLEQNLRMSAHLSS